MRAPAERRPGATSGEPPKDATRLFQHPTEIETLESAPATRDEGHTLRHVAELVSTPRRGHSMPPSALRSRPCKGPSILYCLDHRELFDIWIFWDPAAFGDVPEDGVARLEAYLAKREPNRGPVGASRDARTVELVAAFLHRHEACRVRACLDSSPEYEDAIGTGEEAWTVFCQSEDDTLWERVCLAQLERCQREVAHFHHRPDHALSWEERVLWKKDRVAWTHELRDQEKELRKTGRLWPDHVPFSDVVEQMRATPVERRLVAP